MIMYVKVQKLIHETTQGRKLWRHVSGFWGYTIKNYIPCYMYFQKQVGRIKWPVLQSVWGPATFSLEK